MDSAKYITHAEVVRNVDWLINNEEFESAIKDHLGPAVYGQLRPSLSYIARPERKVVDAGADRASLWLKKAVTAKILAYNASVAAKQAFSSPAAALEMGPKAYLKGLVTTYLDPVGIASDKGGWKGKYKFMIESDPYMRDRMGRGFDRELTDFKNVSLNKKTFNVFGKEISWDDVVSFGFTPIKAVDTATVLPIWYGSYIDKVEELGHDEAVKYAGNVVRRSQPSTQEIDLTALQRNSFFTPLTWFAGFRIGKYQQRVRYFYRGMRSGNISKTKYAAHVMFEQLVPAMGMQLLFAAIYGDDLDKEETWYEIAKKGMATMATMPIPLFGTLLDPTSYYGFDLPSISTVNQVAGRYKKAFRQAEKGDLEKAGEESFLAMLKTLLFIGMIPVDAPISKAIKGSKQKKGSAIKYLIPAPKRR